MSLKTAFQDVKTIDALLTGAEAHARSDGRPAAGAQDLLLSALDLPEGSAVRAFERAGHNPAGILGAVNEQYAQALQSIGIDPAEDPALAAAAPLPGKAGKGLHKMSAAGQAAFQATSSLARADTRHPLCGAHVVMAIAEIQHGVVARALTAMGVDRTKLAAAARAELA